MQNIYPKFKFLKKFTDNNEGVAAIEFAFIAPVMLALYIGLAEVSMLVTADRTVSHATSVTGDLITQIKSADEDDVEDVLNATLAVMGINATKAANLSIDIISFEMDDDGNIEEKGYARLGSGFGSKFNADTVSGNLLNSTSGLVVTRMKYVYHSPSREFVGTPTLKETFMLKPRKSKSVEFKNGGSSTITCTITGTGSHPRAACS
jgi:Flp pilus assembly protein TadG